MAKQQVHLMVGTRKGGFVLRSDKSRNSWTLDGPHIPGWSIYHMSADLRDGKSMYAAANNEWFGSAVQVSRDLGKTWNQAKSSPKFNKKSGKTVKRFWHIEPGCASEPGTVWVGTQPAALFRSDDWGETYKSVKGLTDHPTKDKWGPSGAGVEPDLHTITFDPLDDKRMYVAISSGGGYRSDNGGKKWYPINRGIHSDFMPGPPPEVGA